MPRSLCLALLVLRLCPSRGQNATLSDAPPRPPLTSPSPAVNDSVPQPPPATPDPAPPAAPAALGRGHNLSAPSPAICPTSPLPPPAAAWGGLPVLSCSLDDAELVAAAEPAPAAPTRKASAADGIVSFGEYKKSISELLERGREAARAEASALAEKTVLVAPLPEPDKTTPGTAGEPVEGDAEAAQPSEAPPPSAGASAPPLSSSEDADKPEAAAPAPAQPSESPSPDKPAAAPPPVAPVLPAEVTREAVAAMTVLESPLPPSLELPPPPPPSVRAVLGLELSDDSPTSTPALLQFNYASEHNGAKVLAANREAKHASAVVSDDRDAYLITPCSADKWLVVELSEEVLLDAVALANHEFYSSSVKEFDLYSARAYPPATASEWVHLGRFLAQPSRGTQLFALPQAAWARFLLLSQRSHYGDQRYCTLSSVSAHGKDSAQTLREEMALAEREVGEVNALFSEAKEGETAQEAAQAAVTLEAAEGDREGDKADGAATAARAEDAAAEADSAPSARANASDAAAPPPASDADAGASSAANTSNASSAPTAALALSRSPQPSSGGDNIFKTLVHKIKALELNQSLFDRYVAETNARYVDTFRELELSLATLEAGQGEASALLMQLLQRLAALEARAAAESGDVKEAAREAAREAVLPLLHQLALLRQEGQQARAREGVAAVAVAVGVVLLLRRQTSGGQARGARRDALGDAASHDGS